MRLSKNGTDCSQILFGNNTLECNTGNNGLPYELLYILGFLIAPLLTCFVIFTLLLTILCISKIIHAAWTLLLRCTGRTKPSFRVKNVRKLSIVRPDLESVEPAKPPRYINTKV